MTGAPATIARTSRVVKTVRLSPPIPNLRLQQTSTRARLTLYTTRIAWIPRPSRAGRPARKNPAYARFQLNSIADAPMPAKILDHVSVRPRPGSRDCRLQPFQQECSHPILGALYLIFSLWTRMPRRNSPSVTAVQALNVAFLSVRRYFPFTQYPIFCFWSFGLLCSSSLPLRRLDSELIEVLR
ncbi:hypothetical protein B0H12DRAFT_476210 [Mycena haematopus]|nr:hypothetical protein B0H12DRAFT_476210 [Mycena haematopus]